MGAWRLLLVAAFLAGGLSCRHPEADRPISPKIQFSLAGLDENGLRGPPGGKVAVSYEFVIPDTEPCRREVAAAVPGVQFMRGSRGRAGAGPGECLCIGTTRKNYRQALDRLAALPYVKRVIECHFE